MCVFIALSKLSAQALLEECFCGGRNRPWSVNRDPFTLSRNKFQRQVGGACTCVQVLWLKNRIMSAFPMDPYIHDSRYIRPTSEGYGKRYVRKVRLPLIVCIQPIICLSVFILRENCIRRIWKGAFIIIVVKASVETYKCEFRDPAAQFFFAFLSWKYVRTLFCGWSRHSNRVHFWHTLYISCVAGYLEH